MTTPSVASARRWGNSGRLDPVAALVAPRLQLTPATTEQLMRGRAAVNLRCAEIIRGFRELDDQVRLMRFCSPIDAARAGLTRPTWCAELVQADVREDAAEDVARSALLVAPTRDHARAFIRQSQAERAAALQLEQAVAAHWELA